MQPGMRPVELNYSLWIHSSASPLDPTILLSLGRVSQSVAQRPLYWIIWKGGSACRFLGSTAGLLNQNPWVLDPGVQILISASLIILYCIWKFENYCWLVLLAGFSVFSVSPCVSIAHSFGPSVMGLAILQPSFTSGNHFSSRDRLWYNTNSVNWVEIYVF